VAVAVDSSWHKLASSKESVTKLRGLVATLKVAVGEDPALAALVRTAEDALSS
jgi:hypothetical protein